jgi:hypothetical protein
LPLSKAQVETFVGDLAELFSVRMPRRISCRRRIRCRWKQKTLHLGRKIQRDELAHELAHFLHAEFKLRDGHSLRGTLHGGAFKAWERLVGNYIAQEFGEGEGVIL